jgi:dipeptidyl aminopeptidase/acylaminoacyl peptidase
LPSLVVHCANDFRVPVEQGLGTFTALQRRNVPSQFVYFPDEKRCVRKPQNSLPWHDTLRAWTNQSAARSSDAH